MARPVTGVLWDNDKEHLSTLPIFPGHSRVSSSHRIARTSFARLQDFLSIYSICRRSSDIRSSSWPQVFFRSRFLLDSVWTESCEQTAQKNRIAMYFWLSAAVFGTWALIFGLSKGFATAFMNSYFGRATEQAVSSVGNSFVHLSLVAATAALLYQYWILKPMKLHHSFLTAALLFDLIRSGFGVNHYAPAEFLTLEPELVKTVKKEIGPGRFYRSHNPQNLVLKLPANDVLYFSRWHLETLHNYAGAFYSVPIIFHEDFDNLAKKELVQMGDQLFRSILGTTNAISNSRWCFPFNDRRSIEFTAGTACSHHTKQQQQAFLPVSESCI